MKKKYIPPFVYARMLGKPLILGESENSVSFDNTQVSETTDSNSNTNIITNWSQDNGFSGFGDF